MTPKGRGRTPPSPERSGGEPPCGLTALGGRGPDKGVMDKGMVLRSDRGGRQPAYEGETRQTATPASTKALTPAWSRLLRCRRPVNMRRTSRDRATQRSGFVSNEPGDRTERRRRRILIDEQLQTPSLHKQGLHERDRRIFECGVAVKETLDVLFTGQGFRPETIEGARVAQSFVGVGTLDHVREWSAACGACDPPSQSPMFWDCPGGSLARVPIRAGSADLWRPASADQFGRSRRQ